VTVGDLSEIFSSLTTFKTGSRNQYVPAERPYRTYEWMDGWLMFK